MHEASGHQGGTDLKGVKKEKTAGQCKVCGDSARAQVAPPHDRPRDQAIFRPQGEPTPFERAQGEARGAEQAQGKRPAHGGARPGGGQGFGAQSVVYTARRAPPFGAEKGTRTAVQGQRKGERERRSAQVRQTWSARPGVAKHEDAHERVYRGWARQPGCLPMARRHISCAGRRRG